MIAVTIVCKVMHSDRRQVDQVEFIILIFVSLSMWQKQSVFKWTSHNFVRRVSDKSKLWNRFKECVEIGKQNLIQILLLYLTLKVINVGLCILLGCLRSHVDV